MRRWLAEYREEHAEDDPDATHVQVRQLSALSWLTGGKLVEPHALPASSRSRSFASPAQAALQPGQRATIDVSVATLWKAPNLYRAIDRPSVTNPVDPVQWSKNLSTTASRVWLDSHVQTQALYGADRSSCSRGAAAGRRSPSSTSPTRRIRTAIPGWLPVSQLQTGFDGGGRSVVVVARTGQLLVQRPHARRSATARGYRSSAGAATSPSCARPTGRARSSASSAPLAPSNASIIAQAKRFLGVHYLWGGLSAWGFDCSGIIWDVYRAHGLTIPRDADPQFHHGTPVARSALRPGDLLFFGSQGYAEHVSIYLGNGRMLEAPDSAHRVRIVPVRWTYYIGARRYLSR